MKKTKGLLSVFVLATFFSVGLTCAIAAQEKAATDETKPEVKRQVLKKEVVGEVAGVAANFIAVDYKSQANTTYELAFKMDKNTKFSRKGLKDIQIGDLVAVSYEETIETAEGAKSKTLNRLAKVVEFRQPSKIKVDQTGVLESK